MGSGLQTETSAGTPIKAGNYKIVPFSKSVRLDFPNNNGGFIWNRPVSVLAIDADGEETVIPVHDITRRYQLAIFGSGLISILLIWLISRIIQSTRRNTDG